MVNIIITPRIVTIVIRHDNLNSFIGAAVEPHSITVVTDYGSRGSLRSIDNMMMLTCILLNRTVLDNSEVRLDQMFVASLVTPHHDKHHQSQYNHHFYHPDHDYVHLLTTRWVTL